MRDCEKDSTEKFEVLNSCPQQTNKFCWSLEKPESTISLGSRLTKKFPDLRILLLNGPLGAGKTTLVKGIAKSLKIKLVFYEDSNFYYQEKKIGHIYTNPLLICKLKQLINAAIAQLVRAPHL